MIFGKFIIIASHEPPGTWYPHWPGQQPINGPFEESKVWSQKVWCGSNDRFYQPFTGGVLAARNAIAACSPRQGSAGLHSAWCTWINRSGEASAMAKRIHAFTWNDTT
jgi:hypothetical protein